MYLCIVWRLSEETLWKMLPFSFFMAKSFILSCTFSIESIHFCIIRHIIHRRRPYAGVVKAEIEFQISINNRFWIVSLWMQIEKQMTISILVIFVSIQPEEHLYSYLFRIYFQYLSFLFFSFYVIYFFSTSARWKCNNTLDFWRKQSSIIQSLFLMHFVTPSCTSIIAFHSKTKTNGNRCLQ